MMRTIEAEHYCGSGLDFKNMPNIWLDVAYIMSLSKDVRAAILMWGKKDDNENGATEQVTQTGRGYKVTKHEKLI